MSEQSLDGTGRINEFALKPLGLLHAEGWGPDAVEIDREAGEVKFVFNRGLETDTSRKRGGSDE